jgi:hypothetical protein
VGNIHLRLVVDRIEVVRIVVGHIAVVGHIVVGRIAVGRIAVAVVGGNHLVVGRIHLLHLWSLAMPGKDRVPEQYSWLLVEAEVITPIFVSV